MARLCALLILCALVAGASAQANKMARFQDVKDLESATATALLALQMDLQATKADLSQTKAAFQSMINANQGSASSAASDLAFVRTQVDQLSASQAASAQSLSSQLAASQAETRSLAQRLAEVSAQLAAARAELARADAAQGAAIEQLAANLRAVNASAAAGRQDGTTGAASAAVAQLSSEVAGVKANVQRLESKIDADLAATKAEVGRVQQALSDTAGGQLASFSTRLQGVESRMSQLGFRDTLVSRMETDLRTLQTDFAAARADLQSLPSRTVWCTPEATADNNPFLNNPSTISCHLPSPRARLYVGGDFFLRENDNATAGGVSSVGVYSDRVRGSSDGACLAAFSLGGQVLAGAGGLSTLGSRWAITTAGRAGDAADALRFQYSGFDRMIFPPQNGTTGSRMLRR